ncbi:hypothetical protein GVAV_001012 [Gurleya vavrai]
MIKNEHEFVEIDLAKEYTLKSEFNMKNTEFLNNAYNYDLSRPIETTNKHPIFYINNLSNKVENFKNKELVNLSMILSIILVFKLFIGLIINSLSISLLILYEFEKSSLLIGLILYYFVEIIIDKIMLLSTKQIKNNFWWRFFAFLRVLIYVIVSILAISYKVYPTDVKLKNIH